MSLFNPHDTEKLKTFLEHPSTQQGLKNGEIISLNYDSTNPETWEGILWSDHGDCFLINWNNKQHLTGGLNLNDFREPSFLFLDNNQINSLSTQNCPELEEISCNNNQLCRLETSGCQSLHTLKITGNPPTHINLIACDRLKRSSLSPGRSISLTSKTAEPSTISHESDPLIPFLLKSNNNALPPNEYHHYRNLLRDRQIRLNKEFPFTPEQVSRIKQINSRLDQKYRAAIKQAQTLCAFAQNQIKTDPFVSDYEIDFSIDIYASDKYSHIPEMEGIPIYSGHPTMGFTKHDFEHSKSNPGNINEGGSLQWFLEENHNEFRFRSEHPLKHQHHCWLLHELYDHTYLAWVDILDMEEIWVDVGVVTQNCREI
jgi:hypothetical protein